MKTIFKAAMLLASVLVLFSSCLREQSSLTIEDIPGSAKVTGTLVVWKGTDFVDGKFVSLKEPKANTEVTIKVSNGSFANGGSGTTDYTATTNDEGYFECVIPAVDKGVEFSVSAPAFVEDFLKVKGGKDGVPEIEKIGGVYAVDKTATYSVQPGDIKDVYVEYQHEASQKAWFFETSVPLKVYVGKAYAAKTSVKKSEIIDGSKSYEYNGEVLPAEKVTVKLDVRYNNLNHTETLVGFTNNSGFVQFDIPAESVEDMAAGAVNLTLSAEEHLGTEDYTYYAWVRNQNDNLNSKEGSCDLLAGTYTFAQFMTNCKATYDFRFFTPVVKLIMAVSQVSDDEGILTRVDDDDTNDRIYRQYYVDLSGNYAEHWGYDNFEVEE